ncbi:hypothetical protein FRACA_170012 [Frankia canadensis]|uniref:Uncharacterized protein n=1 Tax=Frankia canadensis TaxID=1836972 RepID=A0A2I2KN38_9ACTN|nr:hypothetical protein FRACA_170012 [Frankia canadensis]SOU54342.1 hypothetical protein FRACA_170012 [Frankia canadensis]
MQAHRPSACLGHDRRQESDFVDRQGLQAAFELPDPAARPGEAVASRRHGDVFLTNVTAGLADTADTLTNHGSQRRRFLGHAMTVPERTETRPDDPDRDVIHLFQARIDIRPGAWCLRPGQVEVRPCLKC